MIAVTWVTVVPGGQACSATLPCHGSPARYHRQRAKVTALGLGRASARLMASYTQAQPETSASGPPLARRPGRHRLQRCWYRAASPAPGSAWSVQSLAAGGRGGWIQIVGGPCVPLMAMGRSPGDTEFGKGRKPWEDAVEAGLTHPRHRSERNLAICCQMFVARLSCLFS